MRVISIARLREFWESRKGDQEIASRDLTVWHRLARHAEWANFAALKQTFPSADQVGNCVVFDVGNNRYRVIGRVRYARGKGRGRLFVLSVMDHAEYDRGRWKEACGCYTPPPKREKGK